MWSINSTGEDLMYQDYDVQSALNNTSNGTYSGNDWGSNYTDYGLTLEDFSFVQVCNGTNGAATHEVLFIVTTWIKISEGYAKVQIQPK